MIEIILDASQLEYFEPCARKWALSHILNLEPKHAKRYFNEGSYWHEMLAFYYNRPPNVDLSYHLQRTIDFATTREIRLKYNILKGETLKFHITRFREYVYHWLHEDELMEVIAIEKGFSWLLYEDNDRRYILEGKPDLVARRPNYGLTVTDHKTQSRMYNKYDFNHQVMNYWSFIKPDYFEYNYIGFQESTNENTFRRSLYRPPEYMIKEWQKEVMKTFDRAYEYAKLAEQLPDKDKFLAYPRSRSACEGRFGVCHYEAACSVPDNSKWVSVVLTHFKEKDEKWRAWS